VEQLHVFLTSAPDGHEWSTLCPRCFTCGEQPWYPLNRMLGGTQIHLNSFRQDKISCPWQD